MAEFLYIYRGGRMAASPEQIQNTMQKWMAWFKQLSDKGHIKNMGNPLENGGRIVKGSNKTVTDGPFVESKDIVSGYSLLEARDLDQAVELSKGCPIFEGEGTVEVRPIMRMNM
jgi:hypothetical protein